MKKIIGKGMALSLSAFMMLTLLPGMAMAEEGYEGEEYSEETYTEEYSGEYTEEYPEEYTEEYQEEYTENTEMPAEETGVQLPVAAEVNGVPYTDLTSAFRDASDQSTVVLKEDITLANAVDFSHPFETITLNFDGHTITLADPSEYVEMDASGGEMTGQGGFLSVKAGTLKLVDNGSGEGGIVSSNNAKAAVEVVKDESAGTHLEISGGRYKAADSQALITAKDAYGGDVPDEMIAHESDPMLSVSISGGTFNRSLSEGYMSDGYAAIQQEDGSFKVETAPEPEEENQEESSEENTEQPPAGEEVYGEDNSQIPEDMPEQGYQDVYPAEGYQPEGYPTEEYPAENAAAVPPAGETQVNPGNTAPGTPVISTHTVYLDLMNLGAPDYQVVQTVADGGFVTRPETDPAADGYRFTGWFADPERTIPYDFNTPVYSDTAIFAGWIRQLDVSFNSAHGYLPQSLKVDAGAVVTRPEPDPQEDGWIFGGWYSDEACTAEYVFGTPVTDNLVLYAKWTEDQPATHTVTFVENLDETTEEIGTQTVTDGEQVQRPEEDPEEEGYHFEDWYVDSELQTVYDFSAPVKNDMMLLGEVEANTYTVHFEGNGGTLAEGDEMPDLSCVYDEPATLSENKFTREGYAFKEWNTASDGRGTGYADKEEIENLTTEDDAIVTLYAQWTEIQPVTFTVTFNMNGHGTAIEPEIVNPGDKAAAPPDPFESGWFFGGWFTDKECTSSYDFSAEVTDDLELFAKWTKTYTVSFDMKGHGEQVSSQTVEEGEKAARPADPAEEGWTFNGWYRYSPEGLGTPYEFDEPVEGDMTLSAEWTKNLPAEYTVTFNMNGHGAAIPPQTVKSGDKAVKPADPSESGWVFGGWFTDQACTVPYTFSAEVTEDLELFAKWTRTYTVSFNMKGHGSQVRSQTVAEGGTAVRPADPRADGWIFGGWFTNDACTEGYNFNAPVRSNLTLYAKWTQPQPNRYVVSFNSNGHGAAPNPQYITEGQTVSRPADLTAAGYSFTGWFREAKCTEQNRYGFNTPVHDNLTLYAGWKPNNYEIQFNANGGTGTMSALTCVYDQTVTLPNAAFTRDGYAFTGWNTAADGSGVAYGNGAQVKNLTNVKDASIVLYAQWRPVYAVIEGANGTVQKGVPNGGGITFRTNGSYSKFVGIAVDNNNVTSGQYTAWEQNGTTYVRLNQSYVDQLAAGRHTIVFMFRDGSTSTAVEVTAGSGALTPVPVTPTGVPVPRTGDTSRMLLWTVLAAAAAAGLTALLVIRRKRQ